GDRLAAPEQVDPGDVGRIAQRRGVPDVRQAEPGGARQRGLHVAADDVGDLAEGIDDVLVLEHLRRVLAEQGAGERLGGAACGGEDDAAGPGTDDVDPAGERVRDGPAGQLDQD